MLSDRLQFTPHPKRMINHDIIELLLKARQSVSAAQVLLDILSEITRGNQS
ncbi:hypothetical protein MICAB_2420008 [Microcystis aeruginosa PCC 9717]|uniref:Uncharacterized protein n=1 Tax=Microcystis aeruginosa PCC 9717 TaxID=1160286 RepID=I4FLZ7_MICAE|nr:hypothetical protein MICAB_2420008 [Microcystis aeruginosa PCC 9717]